ncbi:MAG: von Willebrand factor type A domain-containing protein, partial [Saprospiraceae bacterium]|nr:von Willebrand factor type A domain-containing protein [Saprospiraceae bacterium]
MKRFAYSIVLALVCLYGNSQSIIQGVVYDGDSGDLLIGVNVVLFPLKTTAVTGMDGTYRFEIQDTTLPYEIELTYAGYDSEKFKPLIHAVNKTALWIAAQLDEVIVTAAGQRRNKLMGRVAGIQFFDRSIDEVAESVFPEESYAAIEENGFKRTDQDPVTTFSIDVDRASYANVKRYLQQRQLPPPDAVRIEEMINYFSYQYPEPSDGKPLTVTTSVASCPWNTEHQLLRIGLQGKRIATADLPPSNLVFLLDVSGSMDEWNKLPLVKSAMEVLVDQLREEDRVAIVVYAGAAGVVLNATPGGAKGKIKAALHNLEAGGATAGGAGIKLAYQIAQEHFITDGNNRIILATDGDFNVGIQSAGELQRLIEEQRDKGVYLT